MPCRDFLKNSGVILWDSCLSRAIRTPAGEITIEVLRASMSIPQFHLLIRTTWVIQQTKRITAPTCDFSKIINAVEATDYEIAQMGFTEAESARDNAAWRLGPVSEEVQKALGFLSPPREAQTIDMALRYLIFAEHAQSPRRSP